MECLLTISGRDFDVDVFLAKFPRLKPTACWRRGEPRFRKPAHEDSGLSLALREAARWAELRARTVRAIEALAPVIKTAHEAGAEVGLDFALFVGAQPFTSSVSFSEEDLHLFSGLRGGVTVSAYPVANEETPGRKKTPSKSTRRAKAASAPHGPGRTMKRRA
ncbi:hypothetical protein ACOQFB_12160 [Anaeromyxobacter sp. Red801]|uniref:hypothetical protein n=1 Tax=Anaeromyxobacter sp. Red801 TaxID=3411632 RepID=UPI003BA06E2B